MGNYETDKGPVKEVKVSLPGKEIIMLVTADFEALITDLEDEDKVPCWAEIWPAAYGLARHIWDRLSFTPEEEILELGAGMGLPGIVCGLKGASIILSDFNHQALRMAGDNARANGVIPQLLQADWRTFESTKKYNYILASDILYDPKLNSYLGRIFEQNIKQGGHIFVSHPRRPATEAFLQDWHNPSLFEEKLYCETVELEDSLLSSYDIAVHRFRKL